ncbi:hypothetical protein AMJ44_03835 [candidate division WOR-1 bacterium DG_54_3]|uniref:Glycosyltransferase 2-like domain-containing protein n=1 Tax=candidate division WOR-1 bacterium DG_54_3 TaxID=1703775 RepID=A0A0S7Y3W8_UNCSA|nr:MAG: hypothetical protein AMJ44_03835 [candidate division WOR-1 bacterium DG_54_3]
MPEISVVIATKNEERNIRDCLESVKWADEIIIVDDASSDKTVEVCKVYTDKIFINDSKGSFHKNKNFGLEKAVGDWILSLDADERIPEDLSKEIRIAVKDERKVGYYISRKNFFLSKWIRGCGWYPDYIIRLFRKGVTKWPLEIHDVPMIKERDKVGYLRNSMIHISYTSLEQYFDKSTRYTTRLAQEEYEKGARITKTNFLILFLAKPLAWFFRKYFLMRGYRDGFRGFFISVSSALTIFMTYAKLWEMCRRD